MNIAPFSVQNLIRFSLLTTPPPIPPTTSPPSPLTPSFSPSPPSLLSSLRSSARARRGWAPTHAPVAAAGNGSLHAHTPPGKSSSASEARVNLTRPPPLPPSEARPTTSPRSSPPPTATAAARPLREDLSAPSGRQAPATSGSAYNGSAEVEELGDA